MAIPFSKQKRHRKLHGKRKCQKQEQKGGKQGITVTIFEHLKATVETGQRLTRQGAYAEQVTDFSVKGYSLNPAAYF